MAVLTDTEVKALRNELWGPDIPNSVREANDKLIDEILGQDGKVDWLAVRAILVELWNVAQTEAEVPEPDPDVRAEQRG
jgi:hypothetical protein